MATRLRAIFVLCFVCYWLQNTKAQAPTTNRDDDIALLESCPLAFRRHLSEYSAWHAEALKALLNNQAALPPIVVFRCLDTDYCNGIGDRLPGLAALFYLSMRTRALFFIDMPAWLHAVMPTSFDWRYTSNVAAIVRKLPGGNGGTRDLIDCPKRGPRCIFAHNFGYSHTPKFSTSRTTAVQFIKTNRGLWSDLANTAASHRTKVTEVGLNASTWGCVYRAIFRPKASLLAAIARDWDLNMIGVRDEQPLHVCTHYRSGDRTMALDREPKKEDIRRFSANMVCAAAALQLTHAGAAAVVLASADSRKIKQMAQGLLGVPGVRVHTSRVTPAHINTRDITRRGAGGRQPRASVADRTIASFVDWFALTRCAVWAGSDDTMRSGFSRTAAVYGLAQRFLSCDHTPPSFSTLDRFIRTGSGA